MNYVTFLSTNAGRTDGRTDVYVILYSVQCICIALDRQKGIYHRLNGRSSPVLTATSHSYGKAKNSTPHRIETPNLIETKFENLARLITSAR